MNTNSLAFKERAREASKVRKKWTNFRTKMFGLPLYSYLRNAAPSTQPRLKWPSIQNVQENAKEKGGKERNEEKMGDQIAKKKKKKSPCAYILHRDTCAMTFRECQILVVLNCEE